MSTVTYYWTAKTGDGWETTPECMYDNILTNYAETDNDGEYEDLITNNCPGTDLGVITKVELRVYGYGDGGDWIDLYPFNTSYKLVPGTSPDWTAYADITDDDDAPAPWEWSDIQNLDVRVQYEKLDAAKVMYCAKVEMRVTYYAKPGTNSFSGDSNCCAEWRLDSGGLLTDSKGGNDLTNQGSVTQSTACMQGDRSAEFDGGGQRLQITNADLDSGFPLKSGDTNKKISVCFWMFPLDLFTDTEYQFSIYENEVADKRSFSITTSSAGTVRMRIGYNGGADVETILFTASLPAAKRWYHVAVTFDDSDKSYRIRVYDFTTQDQVAADKTGNTTNNIWVGNPPLTIGAYHDGSSYSFEGLMDEVVVFKDILTQSEIDDIRDGTYSVGGPSPGWNKLQYASEPPTASAWNQLKREAGTGWKKILYDGE